MAATRKPRATSFIRRRAERRCASAAESAPAKDSASDARSGGFLTTTPSIIRHDPVAAPLRHKPVTVTASVNQIRPPGLVRIIIGSERQNG